MSLKNFHFNAHILNEYTKEKEEKKKTTDWPTFHRILQRKGGDYLFSISLMYQMIVAGFNDAC